jgi:hypothetical protein
MNRISTDTKLTIQVIIACILVIAGVILLFMGFWINPQGEIHNSVLIAFGESSTFAGSLLGVDYHYRYKMYTKENKEQ